MGAIYFSIDPHLLAALRTSLVLDCFVETGTFEGDTAMHAAQFFPDVITVERSDAIFARTAPRLAGQGNIRFIHGASAEVLTGLRKSLADRSVVYWLDAHWCGTDTSQDNGECPLLDEFSAIGTLNEKSVLLIDDARYFIAPPPLPHDATQWPDLDAVMQGLARLTNGTHKTWVINDVIIHAPKTAAPGIVGYGQQHGADLLNITRLARQAILKRKPQQNEG